MFDEFEGEDGDPFDGEDDSPEEALGPDVPGVEGPDAPSVDGPETPAVEIPSVDTSSDDVPGDLMAAFWTLVVLANGAVLAFSLGLMFIGFRGNWDLGGRLVIASGLIAVLGWRIHRRYERRN
ncbi:DUF7322 domain-containing protein [Halostella litorea]|uniref:DUF7322 domain-containing protein n=1 Tax=Halostella litorea TaxID=2528831 RepID=UPI0010929F7B|nr:hypothetical protein [Halostella litorea]